MQNRNIEWLPYIHMRLLFPEHVVVVALLRIKLVVAQQTLCDRDRRTLVCCAMYTKLLRPQILDESWLNKGIASLLCHYISVSKAITLTRFPIKNYWMLISDRFREKSIMLAKWEKIEYKLKTKAYFLLCCYIVVYTNR